MSKTDINLSQASEKLEKSAVSIIMREIEEKGYVYEKDVISKVDKARRLKVRDNTERFKKLRADIYNKYGLNTCRLNKELYNQLGIKEKYSSKNVIYKLS
ncbi:MULTISPECIES: hypothetical protein [Enterococcus]|jgi:hypothetical protein|uniref:hypothetical protein n=1 Tax=Enterococcus TaxID=1350 RepID=UPI000A33B5E3|nr:hypothetical protein [Enterococcus sp. 5B3_DIV0040]